jgi:hypothetical protein
MLNEDTLLKVMISLDYPDLIRFKNSTRKNLDIYNMNTEYIYKKKLFQLDCVKCYEDIYLLSTNKATITDIYIKNREHLKKLEMEKFEVEATKLITKINSELNHDKRFYYKLKLLDSACANFDISNVLDWYVNRDNLLFLIDMINEGHTDSTNVKYEQVWIDEYLAKFSQFKLILEYIIS